MNKSPPKQKLIVLLYGNASTQAIEVLSKIITEQNCSIVNLRMTTVCQHATIHFLISGPWNALSKIELNLQTAVKQLQLSLFMQRIETEESLSGSVLNYTIEIISHEKPGILFAISAFLASQNIPIIEIVSNNSYNSHGTEIANLVVRVQIATSIQISDLREQLMLLCDAINADAIFEPERNL